MSFREQAPNASVLVTATANQIVGADEATGEVVWRHSIGSSRNQAVTRVAFSRECVVLARDQDLHCRDQRTGALVWKAQSPVSAEALIVSASGRIFVARNGEVACFSSDGKLAWHELLATPGRVTLAIDGMVASGDADAS